MDVRAICAQLPTVAQVSTMVFAPTCAPMLTKLGISTTFLPMYAPRRTMAPGTARNPAARKALSPQPVNFDGTLSNQFAPCGPAMISLSLRRKLSSTAFFSHWLTVEPPLPSGSATRKSPLSSAMIAASTASRTSPWVAVEMVSRASHAALIVASKLMPFPPLCRAASRSDARSDSR